MTSTRFKPYPETKDSGVKWLGQIPAHWEAGRLKCMASISLSNVDKKTEEGQELVQLCNYVDVYKNEYITQDMDFMVASATREQVRRFALQAGDVLITKDSESWDDIAVPACIEENMPGVLCGYHLALIRPDRERSVGRYLARAIASVGLRDQFWVSANGITRYGITGDSISTAILPVPLLVEQQAIADFLDRETAKIDALVEKKERLIELLQEKRTALITHAVTKGLPATPARADEADEVAAQAGLDPNVPMKESGNEWLGHLSARGAKAGISAHWEAKRLKYLIAEPLKYGANEAAALDDPDLPRYVRITDIDDSDALRDETFRSLPTDVAKPYLLEQGDLLFARSGATAGKTFLYQESWGRCAYAGYLIRARLDRQQIRPRFARYFTASTTYWQWLSSVFIQATIQNVSAEKYAELRVPIPPIIEQDAILHDLDRETVKIDALIAKVQEAIERLKEFRTALISAAVTGKIDVREKVGQGIGGALS